MQLRLPYDYGQVVYHKLRAEKIAGYVTGYQAYQGGFLVCVTWEDSLTESPHYAYELSLEHIPDFVREEQ
jgi:hypothetical protein